MLSINDQIIVVGDSYFSNGVCCHRVLVTGDVDCDEVTPEHFLENQPEDWDALSEHEDWRVRLLVADNLKCLTKLSTDKHPEVFRKANLFLSFEVENKVA